MLDIASMSIESEAQLYNAVNSKLDWSDNFEAKLTHNIPSSSVPLELLPGVIVPVFIEFTDTM